MTQTDNTIEIAKYSKVLLSPENVDNLKEKKNYTALLTIRLIFSAWGNYWKIEKEKGKFKNVIEKI